MTAKDGGQPLAGPDSQTVLETADRQTGTEDVRYKSGCAR